ncbi:MAG TPA: UDP-N-acetylglucosamine 2-epimerase (non-hydrolyzing) [Bacteroidia bacterium]|nr:UDP-N-acetylglucosamine 2-epimerase (non-hydrolyzing) [Bacteroidia bacterium]
MKRILIVVGTRPNFIKVTQFKNVILKYPDFEMKIVHTGQHYEKNLADVFFHQFNLTPDFFLNIIPSTPNSQMAEIMIALEKLIIDYKPDLMIVPGDVNSTFAAAITANKCNVKLAHLESGLRSFDRTMPEEHNRIATDALTDYFFVTEQSGIDNLKKEGKKDEQIFFVGNTMIDTLVAFNEEIQKSDIFVRLKVEKNKFILMTMHRPSNVDTGEGLEKLLRICKELSNQYSLVFPVHPRTIKNIEQHGLLDKFKSIHRLIFSEPLDYFSFQKLVCNSLCVITDSGGVQEESTFRQIPCLTLRANTERPATVTLGTNELIPFEPEIIIDKVRSIENNKYKKGSIPPLWDGKATDRIMKAIVSLI